MEEIKAYHFKMPKDLWFFLKKTSLDQDITMSEIIIRALNKLKEKNEKRLEIQKY